MRKTAFFMMIFFIFSQFTFSEDTASSTDKTEPSSQELEATFPTWAKDLRRTEIITLGSLPFVTIWTTMGYSMAMYGEMTNPFDKSTNNFTEEDQWKVIGISLGVCAVLGIVDLTVSLIQRYSREAKAKKFKYQDIKILPNSPEVERDYQYLEVDGVESAVF